MSIDIIRARLAKVRAETDGDNESITQACMALANYNELLLAAKNLIDQKGRYNTEIAYKRLKFVVECLE